jgi:hypothetical protein
LDLLLKGVCRIFPSPQPFFHCRDSLSGRRAGDIFAHSTNGLLRHFPNFHHSILKLAHCLCYAFLLSLPARTTRLHRQQPELALALYLSLTIL